MTTLERVNKEIERCKEEREKWKRRDNLRLYDYYDGMIMAYQNIRGLLEADKHFNSYSF